MDYTELKIQYEELVFAGKNKDYGSYQLRKSYSSNLSFAMWGVIIVFVLGITSPLVYNVLLPQKHIPVFRRKIVQVIELAEPPSIDVKKQTTPVEAPPQNESDKKFMSPVVKLDQEVKGELFWYADTVGLQNVYAENTLDVQIKYPYGWTFLDQNVKNRLDGVTFWGSTNLYNPPPYIHLEVMEKYLFNPSRFKHKKEFSNYNIYFNDPEELSGQFTQLIYIVTNTNVDYTLKLIMKGKEQFESFQPVFFGMLQTFSFGK